MGCSSCPQPGTSQPRPAGRLGPLAVWMVLVVGLVQLAVAWPVRAQQPGVHYWHQGSLGPGMTGQRQLLRGGPLPSFFQPVEIIGPPGAKVWLAAGGTFDRARSTPVRVGLLIGRVYRIKVTHIPLQPGVEVFPTIELIDRLYAPPDQVRRFPIPVQLTREDLELARQGKFVTRVIYLEDPLLALPARQDPRQQGWFDVGPGRDPLAVADSLGRPVAILRLGARLPDPAQGPDDWFLYGCPPFVEYPPQARVLPPPPGATSPQPPAEAGAEPAPAEVEPVPTPPEGAPIPTPPGGSPIPAPPEAGSIPAPPRAGANVPYVRIAGQA